MKGFSSLLLAVAGALLLSGRGSSRAPVSWGKFVRKKHGPGFVEASRRVARKIGIPLGWLFAIFRYESGFSPSITNPYG